MVRIGNSYGLYYITYWNDKAKRWMWMGCLESQWRAIADRLKAINAGPIQIHYP